MVPGTDCGMTYNSDGYYRASKTGEVRCPVPETSVGILRFRSRSGVALHSISTVRSSQHNDSVRSQSTRQIHDFLRDVL